MNDDIQNRNHPQMQIRATSCEMCNVERAKHWVPTAYGQRHLCDECRLKYQLPNVRRKG